MADLFSTRGRRKGRNALFETRDFAKGRTEKEKRLITSSARPVGRRNPRNLCLRSVGVAEGKEEKKDTVIFPRSRRSG